MSIAIAEVPAKDELFGGGAVARRQGGSRGEGWRKHYCFEVLVQTEDPLGCKNVLGSENGDDHTTL